MLYLVALFAIGIAGMLFVVARHVRELFQLDAPTSVPTAGEVRVLERVTTHVKQMEEYAKHRMKPMFFSSLSQMLKWAEQKLITLVRSVRKFQRELSQHAKVSPRESQYWKDISEWKATPKSGDALSLHTHSKDDDEPKAGLVNVGDEPVVGFPEMMVATQPKVVHKARTRPSTKRVTHKVIEPVAMPVKHVSVKRTRKQKLSVVDEVAPEPDNQTS